MHRAQVPVPFSIAGWERGERGELDSWVGLYVMQRSPDVIEIQSSDPVIGSFSAEERNGFVSFSQLRNRCYFESAALSILCKSGYLGVQIPFRAGLKSNMFVRGCRDIGAIRGLD